MQSKTKRFFVRFGVVLLLAVGLLFLIPPTRALIVGYLRGEPFHKGWPVSYWTRALQSSETRRDGLPRSPWPRWGRKPRRRYRR